ncbi:glucan 1,4-alpha-glucosidase [Halospeciosus flavus]|uniref:Glucan 1,4-alpha-glucosidase n=1 Tax=Halospeciosus flavus TaxID=3032283 RepID=A0ABD5Z177_9EURY|nr:glucan 1,4-alpha-glucosidase [Halospeciosus flavus]
MRLHDALDDYKRRRDDSRAFAGERRTTTGRFTGTDGRLVHVALDGSLRDFSYSLTGQNGIERSRFGVRVDGNLDWFDADNATQSYDAATSLVVTDHEAADVTQYDLTVEDAHLTHVEASDADELVVYVAFGPDRQEAQLSQLRYDDAVEVYHDREHDFLGADSSFSSLAGEPLLPFADILAADPIEEPRATLGDRYEADRLSGEFVVGIPFTDGSVTVATLLTNRRETTREAARTRLDDLLETYDSPDALREAAEHRATTADDLPEQTRAAVTADLRVLDLLSADSGARIAGPDFDPFYVHSGGYGYTWFRDDAEIASFLYDADEALSLDLADRHAASARFYCNTQRSDGSWPHRVWPRNHALAPGWANGRLEAGSDVDYQADQTGSVIAFLADYRTDAPSGLRERIDETLERALDGLDATLAPDGRPVACQNAWEDTTGRFTHTAATFLEAYATLATVDAPGIDTEHAREQAHRVYNAIDDLWCSNRGVYAFREHDGKLDDRYDSASLALAAAHRAYDRLASVDSDRRDRLVSHVEGVCEGLWRETDAIRGLMRYEGDDWRQGEQESPKVWTVSTAWGAHAAAELSLLLDAYDDPRATTVASRSRTLLDTISPDNELIAPTGYLPEQLFDDGTPDSATPLGWPHAIRTATLALHAENEVLQTEGIDVAVTSSEPLD